MENKKKIKDYLHLYLGCRAIVEMDEDSTSELPYYFSEDGTYEIDGVMIGWQHECKSIKPILRPLSDMTDEESKIYHSLNKLYPATPVHSHLMVEHATFETFHWLLKQGFDLFELIESGLAIDKKTLGK